jgi:hypothetical protein
MTVAGMTTATRVASRGNPVAAATASSEVAAADVAAAGEVGAATKGMATTKPTATEPPGISRIGGKAGSDNRNRSCETKDDFA